MSQYISNTGPHLTPEIHVYENAKLKIVPFPIYFRINDLAYAIHRVQDPATYIGQ